MQPPLAVHHPRHRVAARHPDHLRPLQGRREHFLRPGEAADRFGFVIRGVFRSYRVSAGGEESVKSFRAEGDLLGAYAELLQRIPSVTFIQALEDGEVLVFRTADMERLEAGHRCWAAVARRVAETLFLLKESREQQFLELSAEERLLRFQGRLPPPAAARRAAGDRLLSGHHPGGAQPDRLPAPACHNLPAFGERERRMIRRRLRTVAPWAVAVAGARR